MPEPYSGTATIGATEWSLTTNTSGPDSTTAGGTYQLVLNLTNLAAGDVFELRAYEKVISTDSQVLISRVPFVGPLAEPGVRLPAEINLHGWDYTLVKTSGTDRSITWSIRTP